MSREGVSRDTCLLEKHEMADGNGSNTTDENYLSKQTWLDLKRLSSWSLSDDGNSIFHPH